MIGFHIFLTFLVTFLRFSLSFCENILDPLLHDVQILTATNLESLISKHRINGVASVYFYDGSKKEIVSELRGWYNDAAKEMKGMVKVAAINCKEYKIFCDKLGYKNKIMIYPVIPIPPFEFTGERNANNLKNQMFRYIPRDKVSIIGVPEGKDSKFIKIEDFLTKHISVPKVLIFSEKDSIPTIVHSLANEFNKKLFFGFIPNCGKNEVSTSLAKKYKVTTFPKILVYKNNVKSPEVYKGQIKFLPLFEFLNVYAETFVMGGGFSDHEPQDSASKPWLLQKIPELTGLSYNDVCGKHKDLCVIYLKDNEELTNEEQNMLEELQELFTPHISGRGTNFKWMWMNLSIEKGYMKLFNDDGKKILFPSVVVLGTNKRLKFTHLPKDIDGNLRTANKDTIKDLLDKVMGGDARFTTIPGQKLPNFANRNSDQNSKSGKKDEL